MLRGVKFFDEGEYLSARLALADALYGGLSNSEFQKAAYLLAECYIQERNPQGALYLLKQFKPDPKNIPVDRYEFLSAYSQYATGLITSAYFGFKKTYETTNNQAVKEGSLYYLIRILAELGNRPEAEGKRIHAHPAAGLSQRKPRQSGSGPMQRQKALR